ncbi:MAG: TIGR00282 family metallophosphoesterase [Candidatus Scatovivens sp.]
MKILAIGDLVGKSGYNKMKEVLPKIVEEHKIDFTIVNGENVADGMGITEKLYRGILFSNVDVITLGNHTWAKKEIFNFIEEDRIIRPANYNKNNPGKGYRIFKCKNKTVAVINLIGRVSMAVLSENPFIVAKNIINEIKESVDIIIIDFHSEATAEKIALGYYLDGEATIIFGTHTHVQTSDEKILNKGTAYITDIGMTGPINSVIGMNINASIKRFETGLPEKYKVAEGEAKFNGCIFEIDDLTNKVNNILRLNL